MQDVKVWEFGYGLAPSRGCGGGFGQDESQLFCYAHIMKSFTNFAISINTSS
jgi:hypothetical protein